MQADVWYVTPSVLVGHEQGGTYSVMATPIHREPARPLRTASNWPGPTSLPTGASQSTMAHPRRAHTTLGTDTHRLPVKAHTQIPSPQQSSPSPEVERDLVHGFPQDGHLALDGMRKKRAPDHQNVDGLSHCP